MKILFLTKTTPWCREAAAYARGLEPETTVFAAETGTPFPVDPEAWTGDAVVSFLSPWIVPAALLDRTPGPNINFHPAPPQYPGSGCYNFALYDGVAAYGATCHLMEARPDTGAILASTRFPVFPEDTVASLKERTMDSMLTLFKDIFARLAAGETVSPNGERWARKPYLRRELDALCVITPDMDASEVGRRVRATHYPGYPGPHITLHGYTFVLKER
jgi:methionyl-tRNA formyltransferase